MALSNAEKQAARQERYRLMRAALETIQWGTTDPEARRLAEKALAAKGDPRPTPHPHPLPAPPVNT